MRITLCANKDLIGCYALNMFLEALCPEHEVTVFLSDRLMRDTSAHQPELDLLQFFERDLLVDTLFPLLDANPPQNPEWLTFEGLAARYNVSIEVVKRINSPEGIERFRETRPDLIVSVRYGYVFKEAIIGLPTYGILNLHSGILPNFRGTMSTFRAMWSGAPQAGISMHWVPDAGIDVGDVVGIRKVDIEPGRSMLSHLMSLYPLACNMAVEAVSALERGETLPAMPQNEAEAQYFTFPTSEEIAEFHAKGFEMVSREEYNNWIQRFSAEKMMAANAA